VLGLWAHRLRGWLREGVVKLLLAPNWVLCDHCNRAVPVAPHFRNVSVAHVHCYTYMKERYMDGDVEVREWKPCGGSSGRCMRTGPIWLAETLALQHTILDDDRYWEGL